MTSQNQDLHIKIQYYLIIYTKRGTLPPYVETEANGRVPTSLCQKGGEQQGGEGCPTSTCRNGGECQWGGRRCLTSLCRNGGERRGGEVTPPKMEVNGGEGGG